jgi:hypothetical protein
MQAGGQDLLDHLFYDWDTDGSSFLEHAEVERGIASLEDEFRTS